MPQLSEAVLGRALECLYSAVTDVAHWPAALAAVSTALDVPRIALLRAKPQMDGLLHILQLNHDADVEQQYRDYYWDKDPSHRITRAAAVGTWLDVPSVFDPKTTPEPEYMDFAIRHGIRYVAGGKLCEDATSVTVLGLQRPIDHRPFDADDAIAFRRLGPHIACATTLAWDLQRAHLAQTLSVAAIDSLDIPVFAIDVEGRLTLANRRGEEHLQSGELLRMYAGRVGAFDSQVAAKLKAALGAAAAQRAQVFSVARSNTRWLVRVVPLAHHPGAALIYLGCSDQSSIGGNSLRQAFGLSAAEADIARQLIAGIRPKVIADQRNVAESTVRTQIRQALQKVGVRSVAELANVISALPPVIGS